jgi:peptide deformylase
MTEKTQKKIEIVQRNNPVLREKAKEVPVSEISSTKIQNIISDMKKTLSGENDGVAIAAPQIGVSLRIFVVSGIVLNTADPERHEAGEDTVYINPVITRLSKDKNELDEGCLSVRWLYGKVSRSSKATIKAYDEHGKPFTRGASGLLAQVFQHETDHLDGVLFIDKASGLVDIPPEKDENK